MDLRRLDRIPPVKAVMTPFPWHIQIGDSLRHAREVMREHDIRHLPVTEGGQLVGVLSERDIGLLEGAAASPEARDRLRVGDACTRQVFVVELSEPLDRVLLGMAERRIGSALVVKKGRLAGILTATDACRAFANVLRATFARGGNDAA
jgi:acetoin utilization protein AcuB